MQTSAYSTSAGGVGIHGLGLAGADGTFSQGVLQVHEEKNLLATVNVRSTLLNGS